MAHIVEYLPRKHQAMSSNPSTALPSKKSPTWDSITSAVAEFSTLQESAHAAYLGLIYYCVIVCSKASKLIYENHNTKHVQLWEPRSLLQLL
jgi:hypothetical protein